MAKKTHPYVIKNNLDKFIRIKQSELIIKKGRDVTEKEVHEEIAEYCNVSPYTIAMIKSGNNPSLIVAIRMAEYFGKDVRELFTLVEKEE